MMETLYQACPTDLNELHLRMLDGMNTESAAILLHTSREFSPAVGFRLVRREDPDVGGPPFARSNLLEGHYGDE